MQMSNFTNFHWPPPTISIVPDFCPRTFFSELLKISSVCIVFTLTLAFFTFLVENECATTTETTSSKKTGTRSKKNRKRGKRKPGGEVVGSVKSSASQDNKENHVGVNDIHIGLKSAIKVQFVGHILLSLQQRLKQPF